MLAALSLYDGVDGVPQLIGAKAQLQRSRKCVQEQKMVVKKVVCPGLQHSRVGREPRDLEWVD
jgi:hypothetical protein